MQGYRPFFRIIITAFTFVILAILVFGLPFPDSKKAGAAVLPNIIISSPSEGQAFNKTSIDIVGSTDATVLVDVYIDNVTVGSTMSDSVGSWVYIASGLNEGSHSVYATATDSVGNVGTSNTVNFEIDTIPPELTITKPLDDSYINLPLIEGMTEPELSVTVYVYGKEATVKADLLGYWFYFDQSLPEGEHTVYAATYDKAGNQTATLKNTFILDMTRPFVLPDLYPAGDMTQVRLSVYAKAYLVEQSPVSPEMLQHSLAMMEKGNTVDGNVYGTVYSAVYSTVYGEQYFELKFVPDLPLKPYTKYVVYFNPHLQDAAGNLVHPRSWEFQTTAAETVYNNPHGNYILNINTCKNCHRPHRAQDLKLNHPIDSQITLIDDYCVACHDGTAAPVVEDWHQPFTHNYKVTIAGTIGPSACAGCHNPHITITSENPNLLKDYYYFEHNDPTNPYIPNSSEEALCETCHQAVVKIDSRVEYVRYNYNKWNVSHGTNGDYSLCLRCHNGVNASDILTYYNGPSRHKIQAIDGSYLNGNMACADCHNTHGSSNIKMLKEELGHNSPKKFQTQGDIWDAANERRFCKSCHNNETELYGIVAGFVYDITGHEDSSTEYCSSCHGGSPVAAAHSPQ